MITSEVVINHTVSYVVIHSKDFIQYHQTTILSEDAISFKYKYIVSTIEHR